MKFRIVAVLGLALLGTGCVARVSSTRVSNDDLLSLSRGMEHAGDFLVMAFSGTPGGVRRSVAGPIESLKKDAKTTWGNLSAAPGAIGREVTEGTAAVGVEVARFGHSLQNDFQTFPEDARRFWGFFW